MSDFKRLDGPPHLSSNIQDAEFVEIDEQPKAQPQRPKTLSERWFSNGIVFRLTLVFAPLFLVAMCISATPPDSSAVSAAGETDSASDAQPTVQENALSPACLRPDVQDVVSKEVRSMILKATVKNGGGAVMFGLIDLNALGQALKDAKIEFSNIAPNDGPISGDEANSIRCSGSLRIDSTNTVSGQDVLFVPRLQWTISFSDGGADLNSPNFTVQVDEDSIGDGLLANGKSVGSDDFPSGEDNTSQAQQ